ncbi:MAG: peptidase M28, partial [Vicinamibacteria bacterium]
MKRAIGAAAFLILAACAPEGPSRDEASSTSTLSAERVMEDIERLSSDEFGGRGPGSPGEEKTVSYLTEKFREAGLAPGNPDGTYVQKVPLVGITAADDSRLSLVQKGETEELASGSGYVAWTKR